MCIRAIFRNTLSVHLLMLEKSLLCKPCKSSSGRVFTTQLFKPTVLQQNDYRGYSSSYNTCGGVNLRGKQILLENAKLKHCSV